MWFNSLCATDFYAPAIRDCSVSVCSNPSGELEAKVILNRDFLFPLPLRITEARHAFKEIKDSVVFNNKREILRHVTHYLPTSTPTALLTRAGNPYIPGSLAKEYEIEDNFFTISFVSAEGEHFQYVGAFDTVMQFDTDDDKYSLELDLGRAMEGGVTAEGGELYEFSIEKIVIHTGPIRHDIENNANAIRQLFARYGPRLAFTGFEWDTVTNEKVVEFNNTSGVGIERVALHGI
jgi:hypothetical protein